MVNTTEWQRINKQLADKAVTLIAVSKTKPASDVQECYDLGQRHFGENYVQELVEKQAQLPADINWHFIGHLQSNKVKYIAPFVHLIHGVNNLKLLQEINKQAVKNNRTIDVLLQVYIATEETKFGMDESEVREILTNYYPGSMSRVRICGLMGMASNTDDEAEVRREFVHLNQLFYQLRADFFNGHPEFAIRSMGMSGDYLMAMEEGSNMVRIGSLIFGSRSYAQS